MDILHMYELHFLMFIFVLSTWDDVVKNKSFFLPLNLILSFEFII